SSTRDGSHGCSCGGTCGTCQRTVVVAAGGPAVPPADWFTDPQLTGPTPLTITDDGRVFGHIATWGTCHTGSTAGSCVTPPRSATNYAYFRTGVRETTGGDIPVGQITLGGAHADLPLAYRGAIEHYDDVATAVADVAAGEDAHGIWVAGALRPGVTDEQLLALRAASPSGDWRNIGGNLELVAAHAVNSPGFPVARVASGRRLALVASGAMAPARPDSDRGQAAPAAAVVDTDAGAAAPPKARRARRPVPAGGGREGPGPASFPLWFPLVGGPDACHRCCPGRSCRRRHGRARLREHPHRRPQHDRGERGDRRRLRPPGGHLEPVDGRHRYGGRHLVVLRAARRGRQVPGPVVGAIERHVPRSRGAVGRPDVQRLR